MNRYIVMYDLIQVNTTERFGAIVLGTSIYDVVETLKHCSYKGSPVPLYSINPLPKGKPADVASLALDNRG